MNALKMTMAYSPPWVDKCSRPWCMLRIRHRCAFSRAPTLSHRCGYESAGSYDRVCSDVYFLCLPSGVPTVVVRFLLLSPPCVPLSRRLSGGVVYPHSPPETANRRSYPIQSNPMNIYLLQRMRTCYAIQSTDHFASPEMLLRVDFEA